MSEESKREELVEKIRKLMAHASDKACTEAEALQFALKAQKLIAEHDVTQEELSQGGEDPNPVSRVDCHAPGRRVWGQKLAQIVADGFRCKKAVIVGCRRSASARGTVVGFSFFGRKADAEAAVLVFERLYIACNRLANAHVRKMKATDPDLFYWMTRNDVYMTFVKGFLEGVKSELEKQSMELMLVRSPEVDELFEKSAGDIRKAKPVSWRHAGEESQSAGFRSGRDSVRKGRIGGETTHLLSA